MNSVWRNEVSERCEQGKLGRPDRDGSVQVGWEISARYFSLSGMANFTILLYFLCWILKEGRNLRPPFCLYLIYGKNVHLRIQTKYSISQLSCITSRIVKKSMFISNLNANISWSQFYSGLYSKMKCGERRVRMMESPSIWMHRVAANPTV